MGVSRYLKELEPSRAVFTPVSHRVGTIVVEVLVGPAVAHGQRHEVAWIEFYLDRIWLGKSGLQGEQCRQAENPCTSFSCHVVLDPRSCRSFLLTLEAIVSVLGTAMGSLFAGCTGWCPRLQLAEGYVLDHRN